MLPTYVLRLLENRAIAANRTGGVWPRKSWVFAAHVSLGLARWNIRQSYFQVFTISKGIRNNISLSSISLPALITKNSGSEFRNKNRTIKNLSLSPEIVRRNANPQERGQFWRTRRAAWMKKLDVAQARSDSRVRRKKRKAYEKCQPVSRRANKSATVKTMFDRRVKEWEKENRKKVGRKRRRGDTVKRGDTPLKRDARTWDAGGNRCEKWRGEGSSHASAHVRCSVTRMRRPASGFHLQQAPRAC